MEALKKILRNGKLRATPARMGVLSLIKTHAGAVPFSSIQRTMVDTDRITLFRTLNALLDSGIVHKAHFENQETYYALCPDTCSTKGHSHDHVHFKCVKCDIVSCQQLPEDVHIKMTNFEIRKIDINVIGVCDSCIHN